MFLCLCFMSEVEERMGLRAGGFVGGGGSSSSAGSGSPVSVSVFSRGKGTG